MTAARPLRPLLAAAAAAGLLLSGCGGGDADQPAASASSSSSASASAGGSAEAGAGTGAGSEAGTYAVPAEYGVTELPVPPGAEASESNVYGSSFGFYLFDVDPDEVLAFYEQALPAAGFTMSPDVRELDMVSGNSDTAMVTVARVAEHVEVAVSRLS